MDSQEKSGWLFKTPTAWSVGGFGALTILTAWVTLIAPQSILGLLGFDGDVNSELIYLVIVASQAIGLFYVLAAYYDTSWFYGWSVVIRAVNFVLFSIVALMGLTPINVLAVAFWEGLGAVATAITMWRARDVS